MTDGGFVFQVSSSVGRPFGNGNALPSADNRVSTLSLVPHPAAVDALMEQGWRPQTDRGGELRNGGPFTDADDFLRQSDSDGATWDLSASWNMASMFPEDGDASDDS